MDFKARQDVGVGFPLALQPNLQRGTIVLDTVGVVFPQLWGVDFRQQATRLKVPIYFLMGRHDRTTSPKLTEEYFNLLTAPHKELIWFEQSGHGPWMNEPAKFIDVMVNKVLAHIPATP